MCIAAEVCRCPDLQNMHGLQSRHGNCSDHKLAYTHIGLHHSETFKTHTYIVSQPVKAKEFVRIRYPQCKRASSWQNTSVVTTYKLRGSKTDTGHICAAEAAWASV